MLILSSISLFIVVNSQHVGHVPIVINTWFVSNATKAGELTIPVLHTLFSPYSSPPPRKNEYILRFPPPPPGKPLTHTHFTPPPPPPPY